MALFVDIVMITLFFAFMLFIFGGYHKSKYAKREKESQANNTQVLTEETETKI